MRSSGHRSIIPATAAIAEAHPEPQMRAWPAMCCFVVAMICFGAARIHASGTIQAAEKAAETSAVTTRVIDFKPDAFEPSAFADWADQREARGR